MEYELLKTMVRLNQEPYDSSSSRAYNHEIGMKFIDRGVGIRRLGDHKKYANPLYKSTLLRFGSLMMNHENSKCFAVISY